MGKRRVVLIFFLLAAFTVIIVQCKQVKKDSRGSLYAGSSTCVSCHRNISESYIHNAHAQTSRVLASRGSTDSLKLPPAEFIFTTETKVGVEKREDGLYQIAYIEGKALKAERTDLAFGAGHNAYTFAYWFGNKLMQLPLNYLPKHGQWVNSPGFPTEQVYFGRPIIARCLECHSSYIKKNTIQTKDLRIEEEFEKGSLIAGIDCERCHGPAQKHVAFHEANPKVKTAQDMVSYESLPLSRRIDMCGVCHSGIGLQTLGSTFAFKPGDTLKGLPQYSTYSKTEPDVHGNQKQLLEASPCFKIGKAECVSCHDIHGEVKPSLEIYANKCLSCHQTVKHEQMKSQEEALLKTGCVDCHMPIKSSHSIGFQVSSSRDKIPYQVRTHRIAIYEDVVNK